MEIDNKSVISIIINKIREYIFMVRFINFTFYYKFAGHKK